VGEEGKGRNGVEEWMEKDMASGWREIVEGDGRKGREGWHVGRECLWG